jgi:hypothetical protein
VIVTDDVRQELLRSKKFLDWLPTPNKKKAQFGQAEPFAYKGERFTNLVVDEKHYSCAELAQAWGVSPQTIREVFRKEEGVLKIGSSGTRTRRGYKTLRIPESVAQRVHTRLSA